MLPIKKESRQVRRHAKRKTIKVKEAQDKIERQISLKIKQMLRSILPEEEMFALAVRCGVQKRKRQLTTTAIAAALLFGCSDGTSEVPVAALDTMVLFLRKYFGIRIKKQSLQEKINSASTCKFIKEVMMKYITYDIDKTLGKLLKKRNTRSKIFARILLQDSTIISLPGTMSRIFKGCGGSASKASIKCDFIIDQRNHIIIKMKCLSGKVPDSKLSSDIIHHVQEGDLIIRDLGYFNMDNFSKIISRNSYYISRLSISANVYLNKYDKEAINLIEHLEKIRGKKKDVDVDLYIGKKERLLVRLIGVKVPPKVVEARRQQYKRARGRSQEPSKLLKEWHGYTLMITNVPREQFSLKSILKLYKIRWQIELFFKNMKSILHVDGITGKNKHRILSLIYTKLAIAWVTGLLYAYAQAIAGEEYEVSIFKFTSWLKGLGDLNNALRTKDFSNLFEDLSLSIDLLCKKKKTIKQELKEIFEDDKAA